MLNLKVMGQGWPWPNPGPTRLAWGQVDPGHGPAELGLTLRARVKGQGKGAGPGLARPLDSVGGRVKMWDVSGGVFPASRLVSKAGQGSCVSTSTNRSLAPLFWVSRVVFLGIGVFGRQFFLGSFWLLLGAI